MTIRAANKVDVCRINHSLQSLKANKLTRSSTLCPCKRYFEWNYVWRNDETIWTISRHLVQQYWQSDSQNNTSSVSNATTAATATIMKKRQCLAIESKKYSYPQLNQLHFLDYLSICIEDCAISPYSIHCLFSSLQNWDTMNPYCELSWSIEGSLSTKQNKTKSLSRALSTEVLGRCLVFFLLK